MRLDARQGPGGRAARPSLQLAVQLACRSRRLPAAAALRATVRRWVSATLAACGADGACIAVRFVTRGEASALNARFRARDYAPNVLSFPLHAPAVARRPDGDIAICPAVVAADAREQGRGFRAQLAHMVVHGVLHLAGHDHQRRAQAARMQGVESRVLRALGYADPWVRAAPGGATGPLVSSAHARVSSARATMRPRRLSTVT
jgi:probable rRNA maturation factor